MYVCETLFAAICMIRVRRYYYKIALRVFDRLAAEFKPSLSTRAVNKFPFVLTMMSYRKSIQMISRIYYIVHLLTSLGTIQNPNRSK